MIMLTRLARASLLLLTGLLCLKDAEPSMAFEIGSDYTSCIQLAVRIVASPEEVAATTGAVVQLSYSRNVSEPALYNTSVPWSAYTPYNTTTMTSGVPAAFLAPDRYYVNQSLYDAMNVSWLLPYDQRYTTRGQVFVWLYSTDENGTEYAKNGPQSPAPDIAPSSDNLYCSLYMYDNGTQTGYTTWASAAANAQAQRDRDNKARKLALGLGLGLGLSAVVVIVLLILLSREKSKRRRRLASANDAGVQDSSLSRKEQIQDTPVHHQSDLFTNTLHHGHQDDIQELPPPTYAEANKSSAK